MNQANLIGRLTKDPDIRYTTADSPTCVARFTIAIDRMKGKDGKKAADFPSCIAFGKTAEIIDKYVHKGDLVGISGHIQTGSFEGKEGQRIYTTDVVVDRIDLLSPRDKSAGDDDYPVPEAAMDGFLSDSDIPF